MSNRTILAITPLRRWMTEASSCLLPQRVLSRYLLSPVPSSSHMAVGGPNDTRPLAQTSDPPTRKSSCRTLWRYTPLLVEHKQKY